MIETAVTMNFTFCACSVSLTLIGMMRSSITDRLNFQLTASKITVKRSIEPPFLYIEKTQNRPCAFYKVTLFVLQLISVFFFIYYC